MTESLLNPLDCPEKMAAIATNVLRHYSFELSGETVEQLVSRWSAIYTQQWILLATVEALYQGRYKAISVEQILAFWQRRGQPLPHFNRDFERLVSQKFPQSLSSSLEPDQLPFNLESRQSLAAVQSQQFFANLKQLLLAGTDRETTQFSLLPGALAAQEVALRAPYRPKWLAYADNKEPIRQFLPDPDLPEFHAKLKAVTQVVSAEASATNSSAAIAAIAEAISPESEPVPQVDLEQVDLENDG